MESPVLVILGALMALPAAAHAAQPVADIQPAEALRITAVATDRRGAPVPDLTAAEFDVRIDGERQTIELARHDPAAPRLFAFLLDEFHVSPGSATLRVRDAVSRFVRSELRPADLVLVLKPLDPLISLEFTSDRQAVLSAVGRFEGRKGDFTPRTAFENDYIGRDDAAVRSARARIVAAALRALVSQLGRTPHSRGGVVFISDGFIEEQPPDPRNPVGGVDTVLRAASRFDVAIHSLAPREEPYAAARASRAEAAVLRKLADGTGGNAWSGRDLLGGLLGVARDLDAAYQLIYRPAMPGDGKFHPVEVRATRPDVQVRARPGHWTPPPAAARLASLGATPAVPAMPRAGPPRRSALISTWLGLTRGLNGESRVTVTWEPSRRPSASDRRPEPAVVVVNAATAAGTPLFEGRIAPVSGSAGAAASSAVFEAPPGRVELELAILSADGRPLDSEVRVLDVAEIGSGGPVILPPQLVRTRTVREFRAASVDPEAPPSPAREFFRIERLLIRVPAYDRGAPLPVQALLLNVLGQPMRELAPMRSPAPGGSTQFDLPLGPLWPGQYALELRAAADSGTARVLIHFRVLR